MKLISYATDHEADRLGLVIDDESDGGPGGAAVPVDAALAEGTPITSSRAYVHAFPASRDAVEAWRTTVDPASATPLSELRLNSPVAEAPAIMDCSVAPRHLARAGEVLLSRPAPRWLRQPIRRIVRLAGPRVTARATEGGVLHSNRRPTNLAGDGATVPWPHYTSFLDIEPELAVVVGAIPLLADRTTVDTAVIGYVIYNDISARDVQLREMTSGVMSSAKDMDSGSVIGPFLVTPDELPDPLTLDVTVSTSSGRRWTGTTSDYVMTPIDLLMDLASRQSIAAGTIVGMGTVPNTCGLERDEWLDPGERIDITIEGLGTLHQTFGPAANLNTRTWGGRP